MLIITMVNQNGLAEISDYDVRVFVNQYQIAGPFKVKGHKRSEGWQKLVKIFADNLKEEKYEPVRQVQNVRRSSKAR